MHLLAFLVLVPLVPGNTVGEVSELGPTRVPSFLMLPFIVVLDGSLLSWSFSLRQIRACVLPVVLICDFNIFLNYMKSRSSGANDLDSPAFHLVLFFPVTQAAFVWDYMVILCQSKLCRRSNFVGCYSHLFNLWGKFPKVYSPLTSSWGVDGERP